MFPSTAWRRCAPAAVAALLCVLLALTLPGASPRAEARALPQASPLTCVSQSQLNRHLTGSDLRLIRRLLPCIADRARARGTGAFTVSSALSRSVRTILVGFEHTRLAHAHAFLTEQMRGVAARLCGIGRGYQFADLAFDNTPPPVLTPRVAAEAWAAHLRTEPLVNTAGTIYGFAEVRHKLFEDPGVPNPVAFITLGLHCFR